MKLVYVEMEETGASLREIRAAFFNYRLNALKKYISILIIIACMFNILLLIPDLSLLEDKPDRIAVTLVRVLFSLILLVIWRLVKKIKTYRPFFTIISLGELLGLSVFLFVFSQYNRPNLLIQVMGLVMLILIINLIPNQWYLMLANAVLGSVGFFICATVFVESVNWMEFWAAVIYVAAAIVLCSIFASNTERHQFREYTAKRKLERLSSTDYLTDTANRYKMEEEAGRWIDFCKRQGLPLSLAFIDVDNMKMINDLNGHTVGDSILAGLADMMKRQLRSSDILARWGGDEFVLLLPNVSKKQAAALLERIKARIRDYDFPNGVHVSCSFGIAEMKRDSDFLSMLGEADKLMYNQKKQPHGINSMRLKESV